MPSRRTVLGTLGTVAVGGFAGYTWLNPATGYVQEKSIEVTYREANQWFGESIITVSLSNPAGADEPELYWLHDDWEDRFETPTTPTVSDALHEDLRRAYEEVRYVVGVCSPEWKTDDSGIGCRNANATREDFNRVQVHDRVTASYDTPTISIHDVAGVWPVGEY